MRTDTARRWLAALALAACAGPASGGARFSPYVVAGAEYASNVLGFADRAEAQLRLGDDTLDDTMRQAGVGLLANWDFGSHALTAQAEARRIAYDRLSALDHSAHRLSGTWRGRTGSTLLPEVSISDERRMAPLGERDSITLLIERERTAAASVNWEMLTRWWLQPSVTVRDLDSPLPGDADFGLREHSASLALRRLSAGPMSFGIVGGYVDGKYRGRAAQRFEQTSAELLYEYTPSVQSRFTAKVGYASREEDRDDASALTRTSSSTTVGSAAVQHQISGLTSVDATAFRRIASYASGVSAVIESGMNVGLRWQATVPLGILINGSWVDTDFEDPLTAFDARRDRDLVGSLRIEFQPRRWLTIQPYVEYRDRHSNIAAESFDGYAVGLKLRAILNPPGDTGMPVTGSP